MGLAGDVRGDIKGARALKWELALDMPWYQSKRSANAPGAAIGGVPNGGCSGAVQTTLHNGTAGAMRGSARLPQRLYFPIGTKAASL